MAGANTTAKNAHTIATKIAASMRVKRLLLVMTKVLAETLRFLQRYEFQAFLQSIGGKRIGEENWNQEQCRDEHPPI